ncbi:unnamed protein product [Camellia sinensis]
MDETIEEHGRSLAAPIIFTIVVAFQFIFRFIEQKKKEKGQSLVWRPNCTQKLSNCIRRRAPCHNFGVVSYLIPRGSTSNIEHVFISQSLDKMISMGDQSKVIKKCDGTSYSKQILIQELHKKEMKLSYDAYLKGLTILKQLVEPFVEGVVLESGESFERQCHGRDYTMVDIIYQSQQNYLSKSLQLEGFATLKKIKDSGEIVVLPSLYLSKFIDFA